MINVRQKMDLTNAFVAVVLKEAEVTVDDCCIGKVERKSSNLS
jgi:hypothetical protein